MDTAKDLNELQHQLRCAVAGVPYTPRAERLRSATLAETLTRGTLPPLVEAPAPREPAHPDAETFHARLIRAVSR